MSHNRFASVNARSNGDTRATKIADSDLADAFKGMSAGITRPRSIRWYLDDAVSGKPVKPLGAFPRIAEEVIEAGGSFHNVTRPLTVMLAHLRRRCRGKMSGDIKQVMVTAKRESDQAEVCAFRLALSMNCLGASDLSALSKEATEASLEWEKVRELADDRLLEIQEGK